MFLLSLVPFSLGDFATKSFSSLKGDLKEGKTALLVTTPSGYNLLYPAPSKALRREHGGGLKPSE